jgi:glycosyltransferase involved in cell wall biosynthesis
VTILQLISSEGYYGAESMLLALARALPGVGCNSMVAVFRDSRSHNGELERRAAQSGLTVASVPCNGRWDRTVVRRLRQLVETNGVDVLHTHGYKADIYGYAAAWPRRVALVATCHNWPSRLKSMRAYAAIDRLALRNFDRVATASSPVAGILNRWGVEANRLRTIPNGVDMAPFQRACRNRAPGGGRRVGFIGRLVEDKGGAVLITAAQAVIQACPETKFVFAGEGPARPAWEELAARLGIASQVVFIGRQENMPEFYASLDVVVLPSFQECMPMCLLEALSAGKPVVATDVGSVAEVVRQGVTGLLCEPRDAGALSTAIMRFLRDAEFAERLSEQGRAHIAEHFSSEVIARRYLGLYQEALHGPTGEPAMPAVWQGSRS